MQYRFCRNLTIVKSTGNFTYSIYINKNPGLHCGFDLINFIKIKPDFVDSLDGFEFKGDKLYKRVNQKMDEYFKAIC